MISAGVIEAEARLEISQFLKATQQLQAQAQQIDKSLANVRDLTPRVDTGPFSKDLDQAQSAAQRFVTDLSAGLGAVGQSANPVLRQLSGGLLDLGSASKIAGLGIAGLAGTATVALVKLGQEYDQAQRLIAARTGETGAALAALDASLLKLSQSSPKSIGDLGAEVAIFKQRLDETGPALERTIQLTNRYAKATGEDAVQASGELARIFNANRVAFADQALVLDALVGVAQKTGASQAGLRQELLANGAVLRQFGLSTQEQIGLLGVLDKQGIEATSVVRGLKQALGDLAGPEAKAALFALIDELGATTDQAQATRKAIDLFGERAGPALLDAARSGRLSLETINAALDGSAGASERAAKAMRTATDELKASLKELERSFAPVGLAAVTASNQILSSMVATLKQTGQGIDDFLASGAVRKAAELAAKLNQTPLPAIARVAAGPVAQIAGDVFGASTQLPTGTSPAALDVEIETKRAAALQQVASAQERATNATRLAETDLGQYLLAVAKAADGTLAFDKAIQAAGTDAGKIEIVRNLEREFGALDKGLKELTDTGIAGQVEALEILAKRYAGTTSGAFYLNAATELLTGHLEAQRATQDAVSEAQKRAQKELDDITAAFQKAAAVAGDEYGRRLDALANAVLPNLDTATATTLKQQIILNDQMGALATIAAATGIPIEQLQNVLSETGSAFAFLSKQIGASLQDLTDLTDQEVASRYQSTFGALSGAVDASTAALAKLQQESGRTGDALSTLLRAAGASPAAVDGLKKALEDGGAAAVDAREKIAALTTFVRGPNGAVRLKIDIDIENVQTQIAKLQQDFQAANAKRADAETRATRDFSDQQTALAQQQSKVGADYRDSVVAIDRARTASSAQLGADIASAVRTQNDALGKIDDARTRAIDDYKDKVLDAQEKLQQSFQDAAKQYSDGVKSLAEQAAAAIEQSAERQRDALRQAGAAMTASALGVLAALNQQSVAREDLSLRALQGGTQADQNQLAIDRVRLEASQGFQNAQSALALQQARDKLAQDQLTADKELTHALNDLAKQMQKLQEQAQATQTKAAVDAAIAQGLAARDLDKTGRDLNKQAGAAGTAEAQAQSKAFDEARQRQKAIDEQAQQEQQKRFEQLQRDAAERAGDPEGKFRTKQEQAFDEAEKARREEQRTAEKQHQEQLHALRVQEAVLEELQSIRADLKKAKGDTSVVIGPTTVQETSRDMLVAAAKVAQVRLRP